jgi:hypothetical protein
MPDRKPFRRGEIIGQRIDREPASEAEHFIRCPTCGGLVDCRDLGQVLEHEAGECPPQDRAQ